MKNIFALGLLLTIGFLPFHTSATIENSFYDANNYRKALTEAQKIDSLISYIKSLEGATFIRNGTEHSCQEAAEHLQNKYAKHADKIKTAQSFINKLASKSSLTGEPYKVRLANGEVKMVQQMLEQKLQALNRIK